MVKKSSKKTSKSTSKKASRKKAKSASKKGTKKKASKSPEKKKAKGEEKFFMSNGETISDLIDLADAFENMADDVFRHHVNSDKNDFAEWVKGVLEEENLAENLSKENDKDRCQIIVLRHIVK
ncbi:MAG: hypothetical protein ACQEP1_00685 [Nanobdellota archaeon]